jgi:hypothetical protein
MSHKINLIIVICHCHIFVVLLIRSLENRWAESLPTVFLAQIFTHLTPSTDFSSYSFAGKQFEPKFCPVCGVAVGVDDTIENMKAVNLRCLEGVPCGDIETFKNKGYSFEPLYVVPE